MISYLNGKCIDKSEKNFILNVGGVGYLVFSTESMISDIKIDEDYSCWTYLAVRENALEIFGFKEKGELNFFELLISIPGIGPRGALGVMSVSDVDTLTHAITSGNTSYLTKISGIGKKTAEKIVLELRDKLHAGEGTEGVSLAGQTDALLALQSLGYGEREAREALKEVSVEISDTGEKVKEALKVLGGK